MNTPKWYCIDKSGLAILCADEDDAKQTAKLAENDWPSNAPYEAVQLVDAAMLEAERTARMAAQVENETLKERLVQADAEKCLALGTVEAQRDELLAALKLAIELIDVLTPFEGDVTRKARAAIAKAEGGAA